LPDHDLRCRVFLQLLKKTGVDSGEAWKLRWIDINAEKGQLIFILPRITMQEPYSFPVILLVDCFSYQEMKIEYFIVSHLMDLGRAKEIAFRSFRHWKATMEYHKTKDILHVKWRLGHKKIENTLIYNQLVHFESDEFLCKTAKTLQEAAALIEAGYEYVTEMDNIKLFKKRK
jgi:integrase